MNFWGSTVKEVKEIILVEGKYDKNTVSQFVSTTIIETSGFRLLSDKEKLTLVKMLAAKRGLIILTDNDRAGFFIRGRLSGMLSSSAYTIKHAYIPDVQGKEKRKAAASSEGKLGVEGMSQQVIITALERAGATFVDDTHQQQGERSGSAEITSVDLFNLGLTGCYDSVNKRRKLLLQLGLPARLSSKALISVLNILFTRDEFLNAVSSQKENY